MTDSETGPSELSRPPQRFNPDAKTKLEGGDVLIAIGERSQLKRVSEELKVEATRA